VSDADIEAAYQARRGQFEQPARTKVSHVLIKVPSVGGSAAEDQAKARAEAALGRIRGGADFALVAKEMSEDPATASRGGDLGMIAAGELVPEVDKLIQSLKAGELGGPIRSPFGYHVVKVVERVPGARKELKEVAPTLRATLAAEGQLRAHRDRAQEAQRALLAASDFGAEARRLGLTVREAGPLQRGDAVEGARMAEVSDAIFALPPDGVSNPIRVPEGFAIVRLVSTDPSRLKPLAEARADVLRAVQRQKAKDDAQARAEKLLEGVRKGEDLRALARAGGATYGELGPFSRAEPLGDRALGQTLGPTALALPDGGVGGPVEGPGGVYVLKLLARDRPDPAAFAAARAEIEGRLLREKRGRLWRGWLTAARAGAKIEINRQLLADG
jgi:peptidyl-prolyl cis-trans isomerase D